MNKSNVAWNVAGLAIPLLMALAAIPLLLSRLGAERFGLLSIVWTLTAMSGMLDLGIGRATTRRLSETLSTGHRARASGACATAERISLVAGLLGGAMLLVAVALGAVQHLRFDASLASEATLAGAALAAIVPLQALIATYRGMAEGVQSFRRLNVLRIVLGVANFGAPVIVAHFTVGLHWLVLALFAIRLAALVGFRQLARTRLADHGVPPGRWSGDEARALLRAGGWLSLSACASPLLATVDRFFLGSIVSAAAIAAYVVPYELVMQPLVLASAMATVAFPTLVRSLVSDPVAARRSERQWLLFAAAALGAIALLLAAVLEPLLALWLRRPAEPASVSAGHWLCVGMWLNGIGQMFMASIHARGNFRDTALLHVIELLLYLAALWVIIPAHGILGAAVLWSTRALFDTGGLVWIWRRHLKDRTSGAPPRAQ